MYLLEAVKLVKLTPEVKKRLEPNMGNWVKFANYAPDMDLEDVVLAFAYEISRPRIRRNILDKLVGMYNRRLGDKNRAQVDGYLAERANEAA